MPVDMKQMITETFADLLTHKKVEKITVKELVEACNISRQTFYYHFQDIMEVVEYLMSQRLEQTLSASQQAASPQEALRTVISTTERERTLMRHLLASSRKEEMVALFVRISQSYFERMFREKAGHMQISPSDLEAAIRFCSYGMMGILLESLERQVDPDRLSDQIIRLLSGKMMDLSEG